MSSSTTVGDGAEEKEEEYVHKVYQDIASHFSSTRYKPWPIVERFLLNQPNGSVGLDIGCGNGKYMAVNKNITLLGSDRSSNLVQIAAEKNNDVAVVADALTLPFSANRYDFAISIAVIHHFSTPERRIDAVRTVLSTLRPTGDASALIYVWALEQRNSRRGWDKGMDQDVFVPWVTKKKKNEVNSSNEDETVKQRYYHLYSEGELESDVKTAGGAVIESGYEKDNWWAIIRPS